jgi:hypothetical protein
MGTLTAQQRRRLPDSAFAIPSARAYPIDTAEHAKRSLAIAVNHGSPANEARVKAAVQKRYPELVRPKAPKPVTRPKSSWGISIKRKFGLLRPDKPRRFGIDMGGDIVHDRRGRHLRL